MDGAPPQASLARFNWATLNRLQVGRYGEYLAKMEFTLLGFDVYTSEVDDKGIDFVVRRAVDHFYDVQVKTVRLPSGYYAYFRKSVFEPRPSLLATLVVLRQGQPPQLFLIPSLAWLRPDGLLSDMTYEGRRSPPEWGIRLVQKNLPLLDRFAFERQAAEL
jgi:hypothetical protein